MGVTRRGLLRPIMMRDYALAEQLIDHKIKLIGWPKTARILSRLKRRRTVPNYPHFPVRPGTFRDVMISVLGLEDIMGLDVEIPERFQDVEASSLKQLRLEILKPSIDSLREQISRCNTFFLDPEGMSTTPYAVVISDLLEARNQEISKLPSKPTLREVFSTYYGFTVITIGSVKSRYAGAAPESIDGIEKLSALLGDEIKIPAKIIKRSKSAFSNCSEYTKKLLWGMLRVSASGYDRQTNAGRVLGQLGDARALPLLHSKLDSTRWTAPSIIEAIGQIGHHSSLSHLEILLGNRYMRKNAINALGGIRDERVVHILEDIMNSSRHDFRFAIQALGDTRSPAAIPVLKKTFKNKRGRNRVHAMYALMNLGPEGIEVLNEDLSCVAKAIRSGGVPRKAISVACSLPDFVWSEDAISAVADVIIKPSQTKQVIEALRDLPEILIDPRVVESIVKVYRDATLTDRTYRSGSYSYHNYRERYRSYRAQRRINRFQNAGLPSALARAISQSKNSKGAAMKIRSCDQLMKFRDLRDAVHIALQDKTVQTFVESWFR